MSGNPMQNVDLELNPTTANLEALTIPPFDSQRFPLNGSTDISAAMEKFEASL